MGQHIPIPVDASSTYTRFITGQDTIPHIDEKDDVVVLEFDMPSGKYARIQFEAYGATEKKRWIKITGPAKPFPVDAQIAGTLNFVTGTPGAGTNEMQTPAGTHVTVKVYQYDPATVPSHGSSWNDLRDMVFDWSKA